MRMRIELDLPLAGSPADLQPKEFTAEVNVIPANPNRFTKEDYWEMAREFYRFMVQCMPVEFYGMLKNCFEAEDKRGD